MTTAQVVALVTREMREGREAPLALVGKLAADHLMHMMMEDMDFEEWAVHLTDLIDKADIVFGVWGDGRSEGSVIIKGRSLYAECLLKKSMPYRIEAVPYKKRESAIADQQKFDPGQTH